MAETSDGSRGKTKINEQQVNFAPGGGRINPAKDSMLETRAIENQGKR
jgi:hypothetical protein